MMQTLLKRKYAEATLDTEKQLLKVIYFPESAMMLEEDWKKWILAVIEELKKYQPLYLISNDSAMLFVINVELQTWFAQTIFQLYQESPLVLKKFAIVRPQDFIAEISVEQTIEESLALRKIFPYEQRLFSKLADAKKWVLGQ